MTAPEHAQIAILGSCVSRDLLRVSLSDEAECPLYIARQSIISFGSRVSENKPEQPEFPHNFQLASYRSDIAGSGLLQVTRLPVVDVLLIDMVDERHGVYVSPLGEVMTRSIDGISTGVYDGLTNWEHKPFGSPEHLEAFSAKAVDLRDELKKAGLFEKTVVILTPWATHLTTGEETPLSMGKSAAWANSVLPAYEQVYEDLGFNTIRPDPVTVVGDPHHQWGAAAFHYVQAFYDSLAEQIRPFMMKALADR